MADQTEGRWLFPEAFIIHTLARCPHAACKLVNEPGLPRKEVDRILRWLKRRRLVEHVGAWRLTELGWFAVRANERGGMKEFSQMVSETSRG